MKNLVIVKYVGWSLLGLILAVSLCFHDEVQRYLEKSEGLPVHQDTISTMGATWDVYDVQYEYQRESWNDPEILTTPRLQFAWAGPEGPENDVGIWSIKLDGSDLREVVNHKIFSGNDTLGPFGNTRFERSPNNRYIAYAIFGNGYGRRVIDLETNENILVGEGGGNPRFTWATSRYLLFKDKRSVLTQYDTQTSQTKSIIERFEEWDQGVWHFYEYDSEHNYLRRFTANQVIIYDFVTGRIVEKVNRSKYPGRQTYHPEYRIVHDTENQPYGTPNYLVHMKTGKITSLHEATYGTISASLGAAFNFNRGSKGLKKVLKQGGKALEVWRLPKERGAHNITIYNVNEETLKADHQLQGDR